MMEIKNDVSVGQLLLVDVGVLIVNLQSKEYLISCHIEKPMLLVKYIIYYEYDAAAKHVSTIFWA